LEQFLTQSLEAILRAARAWPWLIAGAVALGLLYSRRSRRG